MNHAVLEHGGALHPLRYVSDAAALVAVGGLWLRFFARQLANRPLLPIGDLELRERYPEVSA